MTATSERYRELKVGLRRQVLERIRPAAVLDLFAGRGEMWEGAWRKADSYLGVDRCMWRSDEPHPRLIFDNRRACEALDLQLFNVFDLDAFGEPWSVALLVATHRKWAPGEPGAIVLTDGSGMKLRYGEPFASLSALIPTHPDMGLRNVTSECHTQAVAAWCVKSGVRPLWWDTGGGSTGGGGSQDMVYSATVFEGVAP